MFKVMVKVSVNVAYDSEIAEEKMVVVLQNQAFDVGVFWTMRNFWYCCRQKMTKTGQIYYITMFVRLSVYKTGYHSFVLCHVSGLPDTMKTFYCYIVSFIEELCVVPRWLSYPCTYGDMILRFGRCVSDISLIFYQIPILFHARFDHLSFFFFFFHCFLFDFHQKTFLIMQMLFIIERRCTWHLLGFHWWFCQEHFIQRMEIRVLYIIGINLFSM